MIPARFRVPVTCFLLPMGLDGVELVMAWEESFRITFLDEEVRGIRTPRAAIELICRKLDVEPGDTAPYCLTQRSFYRLRRAFVRIIGSPRASIGPGTCLSQVVPRKNHRHIWKQVAAQIGVHRFPFGFTGPRLLTSRRTVGELARHLAAYHHHTLLVRGQGWTRGTVREVVRTVITQQLGIPEFSDDADFVTDLRID